MLKYTQHELLLFPCRVLIRFFLVCQALREQQQNCIEIDSLYEELKENVKMSIREEKNKVDKYILSNLLAGVPQFDKSVPKDYTPQRFTWIDLSSFFITRWITGANIPLPQTVNETMVTIITDLRFDFLNQLNPENVNLQIFGGLAWTMLQLCTEQAIP